MKTKASGSKARVSKVPPKSSYSIFAAAISELAQLQSPKATTTPTSQIIISIDPDSDEDFVPTPNPPSPMSSLVPETPLLPPNNNKDDGGGNKVTVCDGKDCSESVFDGDVMDFFVVQDGKFYCPYCMYKFAMAELEQAKKQVESAIQRKHLTRKSLYDFIGGGGGGTTSGNVVATQNPLVPVVVDNNVVDEHENSRVEICRKNKDTCVKGDTIVGEASAKNVTSAVDILGKNGASAEGDKIVVAQPCSSLLEETNDKNGTSGVNLVGRNEDSVGKNDACAQGNKSVAQVQGSSLLGETNGNNVTGEVDILVMNEAQAIGKNVTCAEGDKGVAEEHGSSLLGEISAENVTSAVDMRRKNDALRSGEQDAFNQHCYSVSEKSNDDEVSEESSHENWDGSDEDRDLLDPRSGSSLHAPVQKAKENEQRRHKEAKDALEGNNSHQVSPYNASVRVGNTTTTGGLGKRLRETSAGSNEATSSRNATKCSKHPEQRRKRQYWTTEEIDMLMEAAEVVSAKCMDNRKNMTWATVLEYGKHVFHESRAAMDLRDKWRTIKRGRRAKQT